MATGSYVALYFAPRCCFQKGNSKRYKDILYLKLRYEPSFPHPF